MRGSEYLQVQDMQHTVLNILCMGYKLTVYNVQVINSYVTLVLVVFLKG